MNIPKALGVNCNIFRPKAEMLNLFLSTMISSITGNSIWTSYSKTRTEYIYLVFLHTVCAKPTTFQILQYLTSSYLTPPTDLEMSWVSRLLSTQINIQSVILLCPNDQAYAYNSLFSKKPILSQIGFYMPLCIELSA